MKYGEVLGYVYDGTAFCLECWNTGTVPSEEEMEAHGGPILSCQEDTNGMTCDQCHAVLLDDEWRTDAKHTKCPKCQGVAFLTWGGSYQCQSCQEEFDVIAWHESKEPDSPLVCDDCHGEYLSEEQVKHVPVLRAQMPKVHECPECGRCWESGDWWSAE